MWAALQLALPLGASYADATAAAVAARDARTHAESERSTGCQRAHSADCCVCRYLANCGAAPAAAPGVAVPRAGGAGIVLPGSDRPWSAAVDLARSRAPPEGPRGYAAARGDADPHR
jgi:hypothetical protein